MISNKVTHLITTIERGGAEKQLLTLASEQVQSGLNVVVLYLKGKPDLRNEFEESGAEVNNLLGGKSFLKQIFLLSKYLRKNPSPVHAHLPKSELLAAVVIAKKYFVFSTCFNNFSNYSVKGNRMFRVIRPIYICNRVINNFITIDSNYI